MDKAIRISRGQEHPAYEGLKKGEWPYLSTVSAGRRVDTRGQEIGAPDIIAEFVAGVLLRVGYHVDFNSFLVAQKEGRNVRIFRIVRAVLYDLLNRRVIREATS